MESRTFIFIGQSGSGKGTQGRLLIEHLERTEPSRSIIYVETGERFRRFIAGKSLSSRLAHEVSEKGDRQPDFLAVHMWSNELLERLERGDEHIIFDGTPRSVGEAQMLSTALAFYGRSSADVIFLDVSRKFSETHLKERGRSDDITIEGVRKRLDWFEKDVLPAIEYFSETPMYRLHRIKGEQTISDVERDIKKAVFHESY